MPEDDQPDDASAPPPTGKARRFFKLGALTTKVAASYAGNAVTSLFRSKEGKKQAEARTNQKNATRLAETMSELKGAVMKVGQLLSIQDGVMPTELRDTLGKFHAQAPPMHYLYVKDIVESELGKPVDELFASFDKQPLAAASLGQVHRGTLRSGEAVAVKVQYPGIEDTIEADLTNLRRMVKSMKWAGRSFDLTEAFDEVRDTLLREADYEQEADAIDRFAGALESSDKVVVPAVFRERCSRRVLTMGYLEGDHLDEYVVKETRQDVRNEVGRRLAKAIWGLEFSHGLLHADPHPGNYLFMDDAKVALLDFGCVKYFEPEFLRSYRRAVQAIMDGDNEAILDAYLDMRFLTPEERAGKKAQAYLEWSYLSCEPLLYDGEWDGDWEVFMQKLHEHMNQLAIRFGFYVPREAVYLNRVLLGVMCFWNRLEVKMDWGELIREVFAAPVTLKGGTA